MLNLCKHSQAITRRRTKRVKYMTKIDVRPLTERENKLNTRKGMKKKPCPVRIQSRQLPLFGPPVYNNSIPDADTLIDAGILDMQTGEITNAGELDIEPDYIKKYKNVMK